MATTTINVQGVGDDVSKSLKEIAAQEESMGQVASVFDVMLEAWESETQAAYSRKFRRSRAQIDAFNETLKEYFQTVRTCVGECAAVDSKVGNSILNQAYRPNPPRDVTYDRMYTPPMYLSRSFDIIRFDSEYMRSYAKDTVVKAANLVSEAVESLRRAKRHSGWNCPERDGINEGILRTEREIEAFNMDITGLSRALTKGADMFDEWERETSARESEMYAQLKRTWGFEATVWNKDGKGQDDYKIKPPMPGPLPPPIYRPLPILPIRWYPRPILPPIKTLPAPPDFGVIKIPEEWLRSVFNLA
ncbi:MAG: hypothetical protein LBS75_06960 [Synergistaceae bacterium]|jgi:uncharacterized protein YukE|nr:hypothetical protein [Synergistaceae bacterium]